jgi:hypothetical protein
MDDPYAVVKRIEKGRKQVKTLSNSKLNTPTRLKAKELLQKETTNSRKSRMECLLCQQFQSKYGSKHLNSELNTIIKSTIHDYLARCTSIESPDLLQSVESIVAAKAEKYKSEVHEHSNQTARIANQDFARSRENSGRGNELSRSGPTVNLDANQWSVINAIQSIAQEDKSRREKEIAELKKSKFRDQLDEQLAFVERKKEREIEEKRKTRQEFQQYVLYYPLLSLYNSTFRLNEVLERERQALQMARSRKFEADRELIVQQIEDSRRRAELEKEDSIIQDQIDMRRAKARAKEEEDMKEAKKKREKAAQEQLRLENERDKALKSEQKRRQFEEEKRMEREYRYIDSSNAFQIFMSLSGKKLNAKKKQELKHSPSVWRRWSDSKRSLPPKVLERKKEKMSNSPNKDFKGKCRENMRQRRRYHARKSTTEKSAFELRQMKTTELCSRKRSSDCARRGKAQS